MNLVRDIRVTSRFLLKSPRYTAAIAFILTATLGTNTAIFSAVYGILLKPLPVQDPERLVVIWDTAPACSLPVVELSYRTVEHWSRYNTSFASVAAIGSSTWPAILRGRGTPVRVASAGVSASFFKTLGASPALGRALFPSDDVPNAAAVAVLSHAAWVQYLGRRDWLRDCGGWLRHLCARAPSGSVRSRRPATGMSASREALVVAGGAVDRGDRGARQTQIHRELSAVMRQVHEGVAQHHVARLFADGLP